MKTTSLQNRNIDQAIINYQQGCITASELGARVTLHADEVKRIYLAEEKRVLTIKALQLLGELNDSKQPCLHVTLHDAIHSVVREELLSGNEKAILDNEGAFACAAELADD